MKKIDRVSREEFKKRSYKKKYTPPDIKRHVFNKFNMPLLIEVEGKEAVMLEPRRYLELEEGDRFSNSTSKLFAMGHLIIIANNR